MGIGRGAKSTASAVCVTGSAFKRCAPRSRETRRNRRRPAPGALRAEPRSGAGATGAHLESGLVDRHLDGVRRSLAQLPRVIAEQVIVPRLLPDLIDGAAEHVGVHEGAAPGLA